MSSVITRELGSTGQESTILTFGALALDYLPQNEADELVESALDRGINHFDVAPAYGTAEVKLGPKLREHRDEIFLGCKTKERTKEGARESLERSLNRLGVDCIDLYQFHAVTDEEEVDAITGSGGALEAFQEAKEEGLINNIGVTSHSKPSVVLDAIDRIDPDTVMFPINSRVMEKEDIDPPYPTVLETADNKGIGVIGIKAFAKEPWPPKDELSETDRPYETWYRPYDTQSKIDDCFNFALSQNVTTVTNVGDPQLVPMILDAAERFETLSEDEQEQLIEQDREMTSPVPADLRNETPEYLHSGVDDE